MKDFTYVLHVNYLFFHAFFIECEARKSLALRDLTKQF